MRKGITFILLLMLLCGCVGKERPVDYRKGVRNVILIGVDTLAARNLGFQGYERDTSPFMDELAGKSVVFEGAYTTKALTLPSFTTLLSGLHPITHGVQGNGQNLPRTLHMLADDFRGAEFLTVGFAASGIIGPQYGMNKGFDYYFPSGAYEIPGEQVIAKVQAYLEGSENKDMPTYVGETKPLFLFIHFFDPHTDYTPDPSILRQFADPTYAGPVDGKVGLFEKYNDYEVELNEADLLHTRDLYDAEVRSFDNKLRSLFDLLERTGLMDNSVVVLTADHGENLGEHHYLTHGHPYEPALHIPLLFHFPKDLGAGIRISSLVEGTDIVPTLMDLAGVAVPDGLDGHSLLPLIQDPSGESGGGRQFLLSCGGFNNESKRTYSLFDGRYRLIKDIRWSEKPLLYDISVDPSEENDISDANPDNVELFSALIQAMSSGALPPSEVEYDTQTEEMLRSLGYIH